MTSVMVFVDDAVRGTLPDVCAKDGVPTHDRMVVRDELGDRAGLGVAWLLLLFGPIGWLGLLLIAFSRGARGEVLTVQVPMSEPAYTRLKAARRMQRVGLTVAVAAFVAWFITTAGASLGELEDRMVFLAIVAALVGGIVSVLVGEARVRAGSVQVDLDASRRWVTLSRVHPAFVAACQAHEQRQPQRT